MDVYIFYYIRLVTGTFGTENDIQHYLQKIMEIDARFLFLYIYTILLPI